MKFLVDAQLPKKLSLFIKEKGFDSIHTIDLPKGNNTSDTEIIQLSISQNYIVISKDADFWDIYKQKAEPYKLIILKVGNFTTKELISLFDLNLELILEKINDSHVIEINRINIISIL